jgi:prolipoprotein diacylglyceryl transferase
VRSRHPEDELLWASIPSPPQNTFEIGPLTIHFYGIMIGIGVLVAAIVTQKRYEKFGGDPTILDRVILWTVLIGFVGARLAYVSTHTARYEGRWYAVLFIWEGGLALYGGLTAGALAAVYMMRKLNGDFPMFADAVAVGLPLAQAIGRLGNYFNQELFGTPSSLPWAIEIDPANRPAQYMEFETFHPTFLYEALWNIFITVPVILYAERRFELRKGASFPIYMIVYGTIRFLTELLRTDTTFRFLGLSRNAYVSLAAILGGAILLYLIQTRGSPRERANMPEAVDS